MVESDETGPVFKEIPVPVPGPTQVLIRVDSAPINPSDLLSIVPSPRGRPYPFTLGIEGAGVVVSERYF